MISDFKKYLKADYFRIVLKNKLGFVNFKEERVGKHILRYPYRPYFYGLYYEIFIEDNYSIKGLENCKNIIDAGSNIGVSVSYFSQTYPEARIECFEPNPEAIEYLRENIERNKMNASINKCALGSENKQVVFYTDSEIKGSSNAGSVKLMESKNRPASEITVDSRKLSDFIKSGSTIDILKLDIEGGEMGVMHDLVATGKIDQIRTIFAEFHYDPKNLPQSLSEFLGILEDSKFHYYINKRQNIKIPESLTHSYIIFAFK